MPNTIIIGSILGSKGPETARRVSLIVLPGLVYSLNNEWFVGGITAGPGKVYQWLYRGHCQQYQQ